MSIQDLRQMNFFSQIPYYIFFAEGISINELRFYTFIHQFENNPNPKKRAFFNFRWIANILGIDIRSAKRVAQKLKDRGFIAHKKIGNHWIWNTTRFEVIASDEDGPNEDCFIEDKIDPKSPTEGTIPKIQEVTQNDNSGDTMSHPPVTQHVTPTINNININNIKTTTTLDLDNIQERAHAHQTESSSGFIVSEELDKELLHENLGKPVYAKDNREFLFWCKYCLDNLIRTEPYEEKVRILKSWIRKGGLTKPKGFGEKKTQEQYAAGSPSSKSSQNDFKYDYESYVMSVAGDIRLRLFPETKNPMNFDDWLEAGMPKREKYVY